MFIGAVSKVGEPKNALLHKEARAFNTITSRKRERGKLNKRFTSQWKKKLNNILRLTNSYRGGKRR